jgi:hypothetical protein
LNHTAPRGKLNGMTNTARTASAARTIIDAVAPAGLGLLPVLLLVLIVGPAAYVGMIETVWTLIGHTIIDAGVFVLRLIEGLLYVAGIR